MRLIGKHATITIGGLKVGDAYDCTVDIGGTMDEQSAWGDDFDVNAPIRGSWKMTCKHYGSTVSNLTAGIAAAIRTWTANTPVRVVLFQIEGSPATRVFEGDGWVSGGSVTIPKTTADGSFEISGTGTPVFPT